MPLPGQETYNQTFGGGAWQAPMTGASSFMKALQDAEMLKFQRERQAAEDDWRRMMASENMDLRREQLAQAKAERDAKKAAGRPLGAQTAEELGDRLAIPVELQRNAADVKAKPELLGPENAALTKIPFLFAERKDVSSKVGAIRKLAARAIEGARLTDSDMAYYQKNLPSETDTPREFENKTKNLVGLLSRATKQRVESLGKAGFDIGGYASDVEQLEALGKQSGETGVDGLKAGTVEDGYEFLGGDPADPNSWKKVQ